MTKILIQQGTLNKQFFGITTKLLMLNITTIFIFKNIYLHHKLNKSLILYNHYFSKI